MGGEGLLDDDLRDPFAQDVVDEGDGDQPRGRREDRADDPQMKRALRVRDGQVVRFVGHERR